METIQIKRIYDEPFETDGYRILVDKLWPRGVSKAKAQLNEWNKEITPSAPLRQWFNHQPEKFEEFTLRYREELLLKQEELDKIRAIAQAEPISLLYAAKSPTVNHAIVLKNVLINKK